MADPGDRHARQRLVPGFTGDAQGRLRASSALVAGCGALGCAIADQLVRAGVGRVVIVDRDVVEPSNLQRQSLFATADVGVPKAIAARARLEAVDPSVRVEAWVDSIERDSIEDYMDGIDVAFDGFDAMEPRYLLNDVCVRDGVSWVYCAAIATQARAMCTAGLLPTRFIHLALSDAEVTRRLTGRRVDPAENKVYHLQDAPPPNGEVANRLVQRGEDMPPRVAERLAAYRQHMSGVLPCFSKVLAELNGDEAGGVDAILERALLLVSPYMPSRAPRAASPRRLWAPHRAPLFSYTTSLPPPTRAATRPALTARVTRPH